MMHIIAVASIINAPELPVQTCAMRNGAFRVGIVIKAVPAVTPGRNVLRQPKPVAARFGSTLVVHY